MLLLFLFFVSVNSLITENLILSHKDISPNNLQVKCTGILDKIKINTLIETTHCDFTYIFITHNKTKIIFHTTPNVIYTFHKNRFISNRQKNIINPNRLSPTFCYNIRSTNNQPYFETNNPYSKTAIDFHPINKNIIKTIKTQLSYSPILMNSI